ncbi:hypothetical protein [Streptomyces sp. FBKL.4005]|uniref:hypothetical protein n=1 Tax=Streptomyces sp. FBKL.4005 TaxID=2015515 RepID=UPI00117D89ED|nr:hypothetical protein [Streptomyces sp. FBKL.4005]
MPDSYLTTSVDVMPWADAKWRAVLAHRGEVARERPLPGILACPAKKADRIRIIQTEYFARLNPSPAEGRPGPADHLTPRPVLAAPSPPASKHQPIGAQ